MQVGEGEEAQGTGNNQANGAHPDVLQELVALILVMIRVYHSADDGIVDGIPNLANHKQRGIDVGIQLHELCPVDHHEAFEAEAHVARKVTGCIGQLIPHAKLPQGNGLIGLRHIYSSYFVRDNPPYITIIDQNQTGQ